MFDGAVNRRHPPSSQSSLRKFVYRYSDSESLEEVTAPDPYFKGDMHFDLLNRHQLFLYVLEIVRIYRMSVISAILDLPIELFSAAGVFLFVKTLRPSIIDPGAMNGHIAHHSKASVKSINEVCAARGDLVGTSFSSSQSPHRQ